MIAAALAALLQLAGPAQAQRDCGARSGHTVVGSAAVRVFYIDSGTSRHYRACWRRGGGAKPVELVPGGVDRPDFVNRFRLRGRYLAFVQTLCEPHGACDSFEVTLVDVKRTREVMSTQRFSQDYLPGSVTALVATRGGAAAFLATDGDQKYVQKLDSFGIEEIDRGSDVHSLTLKGGHLHWLHGTHERDDRIAHIQRCGPARGATTWALSRHVRVYFTDRYHDDEYRWYACTLPGGKPYLLGIDTPGESAFSYNDYFELRGDNVVWLEVSCYLDCHARIHGADARRRTAREGELHDFPLVFVNQRGFAAEFVSARGDPTELFAFDSGGERKIDEGDGIDPGSIAVFADSVVWRNDGVQRSAPLR